MSGTGSVAPEMPRPGPPSVRAWRKRARAARREHHTRTAGETLTDLYTAFWFVLIYGVPLYLELDRHLGTPGALEGAVARHWLGTAALLAGAGLAWRGLRALGPMMASPAELHWAVSSPLPRRRWLAGRFAVTVGAGAAVGAFAALIVVLLGVREGGPGTAAAAGAVYGIVLVAAAVLAQKTRRGWSVALDRALAAAGALLAAAVIAAHYAGRAVPPPVDGLGAATLVVGVPLAATTLWRATAALPRLDRNRLGAGAQIAAAAVTAAVWLDVTVLGGVLEVRRWRRVGRVRSRRFLGAVPALDVRFWALLQAEARRTARRPGVLVAWVGLALAQYGMAVAAPSLAGVSRVVLAYVVVGRLMAGLRRVVRSDALRRSLGGSETLLRAAHVVVPAAATLLWWLVTTPADPVDPGLAVVLALGTIAAAYRAATRGPMDYDTGMLDTGIGALPVGLLLQLARGPDVLGAVLLARVLVPGL